MPIIENTGLNMIYNDLYMNVCLPCFDEEWCEVSGTLRSLAKNILVHRKRPNKSFRIHVSVYIIQDGWSKASDSFKEGITSDFKCPSKYFIDVKFLNKTNEALIFMPETEIFYPAYNDVNEHSGVTFHPIFITKFNLFKIPDSLTAVVEYNMLSKISSNSQFKISLSIVSI